MNFLTVYGTLQICSVPDVKEKYTQNNSVNAGRIFRGSSVNVASAGNLRETRNWEYVFVIIFCILVIETRVNYAP